MLVVRGALMLALLLGATAVARADVDEAVVVSGTIMLEDGALFHIGVESHGAEPTGNAWLARAGAEGIEVIEIAIDCLEASWHQPVYPIPPYLPYHMAQASGSVADGTRYFITAYDVVPRPVGLGDRLVLDTEPGDGACGAHDSIGSPVAAGEITIGP